MWKRWNGGKLDRRFREYAGEALTEALEVVGGVSDQQVPLDEGTLLRSKTIRVQGTTGKIGYGGGPGTGHPIIPYAVKWHETPANFQHSRKHNYLRDPFNKLFADAINSAIDKRRL